MNDNFGTKFNLLFASTSCSCRPNTLDWCQITSLILFSAKKDLCVVGLDKDTTFHRILETVEATHSGEITSVKILSDDARDFDFSLCCTTSSIGELVLWELRRNIQNRIVNIKKYKKDAKIDLAKLMALDLNRSKILLATVQFNQIEIQFVDQKGSDLCPASSLKFPNAIILDIDFAKISQTIIMAIALSNGIIDLFVSHSQKEQDFPIFQRGLSLNPIVSGWVRTLAFKTDKEALWLSSTSENIIKVWKFTKDHTTSNSNDSDKLKIVPKQFFIDKEDETQQRVEVTLESIISGQNEAINSIAWHPNRHELLSSGADKSIFRWQYSQQDSLWLPISRVGEVGGEAINFYDAKYSPDGKYILCHSLLGGFYLWEEKSVEELVPKSIAIGGHYGEITDLCWDTSGTFLLTCSLDMTTRIFARLKQSNELYFEIARPQTHGHALNCLTSLKSYSFVSGGEEKIFRVFQASSSFVKNLTTLAMNYSDTEILTNLPKSAFQTELTLTNKASNENNNQEDDIQNSHFTEIPKETELNRFTLFPEIHKLYGHGFEVYSCAASHNGRVLATSCKASQLDHAAILLWDTVNWQLMKSLKAHQLTVTRLAFSMDSRFLLSVSRDRTWTLFRLLEEGSSPFDYVLHYRGAKAASKHSRIIWDCAWSPDSYLFATCSRDKTLNLWNLEAENNYNQVSNTATFTSDEALTAVDFAPKKMNASFSSYLIAVGSEDGRIILLSYDSVARSIKSIVEFSRDFAHSDKINRLRFRPLLKESDSTGDDYLLASASANQIVKIFSIKFD